MGAAAMGAMSVMTAGTAMAEDAPAIDGLDTYNVQAIEPEGLDKPWCGAGSVSGDWSGTPEDIKALGGCTMPLDELNARRKMYVDAQTEYVKADGTVVPEVYVKARALHHTYGHGIGNAKTDACFDSIMAEMSEDEAQAYLDLPMGKPVTAYEFAAKTGRTVEECEAICETLFSRAWLARFADDNGTFYYHAPWVQGTGEWHLPELWSGKADLVVTTSHVSETTSLYKIGGESGAPFITPVPCTPDIVKGEGIYPMDNVMELWKTKNKFSLSPCACRTMKGLYAGLELPGYPDADEWDFQGVTSPVCGHDVETCLSCGEEAQFWIDHKVGREITKEEALARLQKSIEQGFVIQRTNSLKAETICSCHGDCCGIMGDWKAVGTTCKGYQNISHYNLIVETETCAKCGACAERCPMAAITMDEETGYPVITGGPCVICGQCAYICPTGSRWLERRDESEFLAPYEDIPAQNNLMAAYRFENGLIW